MSETLAGLLAVREQRVQRALRELAARRQSAAARAQALHREEAALQQREQAHQRSARQLFESARSRACHVAQLCAELAYLQGLADQVAQQRTALSAARRALHAALAELRVAYHHTRQARAARERTSLVQEHARRAALLRRNLREEQAAEEIDGSVSCAASEREF
jgi:hypothetical protein